MVLDSSAIVAIFKRESGYEALERKIDEADVIWAGAPTLVETAIVLSRQTGRDQSGRGFDSAARLNDGDCLSYAVAVIAKDHLLFTGDDFPA